MEPRTLLGKKTECQKVWMACQAQTIVTELQCQKRALDPLNCGYKWL